MPPTLAVMEQQLSDEALMLAYQQGDAAAFETLYEKHKGGLYRYILRFCKQPALTEELYQDVWMKVINARDNYQVKAKFSTWIYQIAHNHVIDYFRKENRSTMDEYADVDEVLEVTPGQTQQQPEKQAELEQSSEHLLALIAELPAEQREVLLLKEESGLSLEQIASVIGVNAETAKSRLRYAIKKLRQGMS